MNPWTLDSTALLVWGIVVHMVADWPLQNEWMANHKAMRRPRAIVRRWSSAWTISFDRWWDRHPAAYVHAGIHGALLAIVFGWVALPLAGVHLLIDTRGPVAWWSRLIRQTQPDGSYDMGTEVRIWTDQVFHIACIAVAALIVA